MMIRTHAPTESMIGRVLQAFRAAVARGMTFVVSIDSTLPHGKTASRRLRDEIGSKHVHSYTEADMLISYPVLHEMQWRVAEACRKRKWDLFYNSGGQRTRTLAWGLHAECINLWVQKELQEAASRRSQLAWDYLWVLEDDIGKKTPACREGAM